jgi:L-fuconolactonase
MRIDAHQHFWRFDPGEYGWMQPGWSIRRDFLPADLQPLLAASGVDGCVAVQARQSLVETRFLLELARDNDFIQGVVGWVDLCSYDLDGQLESLLSEKKFVGVRHVLQDEPDDQFMLRPAFLRGISRLRQYGLAFDILIYPKHLPHAVDLVRRFPEQRFVLDHLAKPFIKDRLLQPWNEHIRALAAEGNVACKISGMVTEAAWAAWKTEDFRPYMDVVWEAFGENRVMYGSDWPVCTLAAQYSQVFGIVSQWLQSASVPAREKVLGGNATTFYQLRR